MNRGRVRARLRFSPGARYPIEFKKARSCESGDRQNVPGRPGKSAGFSDDDDSGGVPLSMQSEIYCFTPR